MVARSCGHQQEFQEYEVDKYRDQRLAKFQSTRCAECVARLNAERQAAIPKGEAVKLLPAGTQVSLTLRDGSWSGTLAANGKQVETAGERGAGPQTVIGTLAQLWISANKERP
jgi:hypothetical protein